MLAQIHFDSGHSQSKPLHLRVCVCMCLFLADATTGTAAAHTAGCVGMKLCSISFPWSRGHSLSPAPRGASQPQASGGQSRSLEHGSESALSLQTPPASAVQEEVGKGEGGLVWLLPADNSLPPVSLDPSCSSYILATTCVHFTHKMLYQNASLRHSP